MIRTALVALLVVFAVPSAAGASLMPAPPRAVVVAEPCPYLAHGGACAHFPSATAYAPGGSAFEREHELGHLFDDQVLTDEQRAWFARRFGMSGAWFPAGDPGTRGPGEVFADAYAACATGARVGSGGRAGAWRVSTWQSAYGYLPKSARAHQRVCNAIAVAGIVNQ